MLGNYTIYKGESSLCYENKCCATNMHDCCTTDNEGNIAKNNSYSISIIVGGIIGGIF